MWESGYTKEEAKARKAQIEYDEARGIKTHTINEEHHGLLNKSIETAQAKRLAEQITPIDKQAMTEIENSKNELMLRPFMEDFIRIYGRKKWGTSYYGGVISKLENYVYEYWKSVPISKITVKAIDEYYDWLITECKPPTPKYNKQKGKVVTASVVNDIHKVLRCAFKALDVSFADLINSIPCIWALL